MLLLILTYLPWSEPFMVIVPPLFSIYFLCRNMVFFRSMRVVPALEEILNLFPCPYQPTLWLPTRQQGLDFYKDPKVRPSHCHPCRSRQLFHHQVRTLLYNYDKWSTSYILQCIGMAVQKRNYRIVVCLCTNFISAASTMVAVQIECSLLKFNQQDLDSLNKWKERII